MRYQCDQTERLSRLEHWIQQLNSLSPVQGVCGGPLAFNSVILVPCIAIYQSLACVPDDLISCDQISPASQNLVTANIYQGFRVSAQSLVLGCDSARHQGLCYCQQRAGIERAQGDVCIFHCCVCTISHSATCACACLTNGWSQWSHICIFLHTHTKLAPRCCHMVYTQSTQSINSMCAPY
jgi:hypothetical protein